MSKLPARSELKMMRLGAGRAASSSVGDGVKVVVGVAEGVKVALGVKVGVSVGRTRAVAVPAISVWRLDRYISVCWMRDRVGVALGMVVSVGMRLGVKLVVVGVGLIKRVAVGTRAV
jgi:hypothetical protein